MKLLLVRGMIRRHRALKGFYSRLRHFEWIFEECTLEEIRTRRDRIRTCDDVAILGGDGTLQAALALTAPRPILVVPAGTGNDFARALGIESPSEAAETLRRGHRAALDLGEIRYETGDGTGRIELFANGIGVGLDGVVAARHAQGMPYALGTLAAIARLPRFKARVSIDNNPAESLEFLSLLVANGSWFGNGFCLAPQAKFDDGVFDLVGIRPVSRATYLATLPAARKGQHLEHPAVFTRRCRHVVLESETPLPFHIDGEPRTATRIEITMLPGARSFYINE